MSAVLRCYVDDEGMKWLEKAAAELGRSVEQLAEAAIENAAIEYKAKVSFTSALREGET